MKYTIPIDEENIPCFNCSSSGTCKYALNIDTTYLVTDNPYITNISFECKKIKDNNIEENTNPIGFGCEDNQLQKNIINTK